MKPQDLGSSLVMRNASAEDIPALLEHVRVVHGESVVDEIRAMLENYPRFSWEDSFIIVNPESGEVVSCVILLQNAWTLDGIEIPSVEMEAVGTLETYRGQGHMHLLNEEFEKRTAELQPAIMAIAGIPNFYRNFGYEYAASMGGGYPVNPSLIPKLPDGEEESVSFEAVDAENIKEFLSFREDHRPESTWQRKIRPEDTSYLLFEPSSHEHEAFFFHIIKEKGKTVGVFILSRWENKVDILELYLKNTQHLNAVLRFAITKSQEWNSIPIRIPPPNQTQLRELVRARTQVMEIWRYAWYVKIPSIPRFIDTIRPLFSNRLRDTELHDFTGELTLTTYKEGYSLSFQNGAFTDVSESNEKKSDNYHLRIPKGSLTRLLMGYETLEELASHEPDVMCASVMRPLVNALFPKLKAAVDPFF